MSRELVPRLNRSAYAGLRRYLLAICTFHRTNALRKDPVVEGVLMQLRQRAIDHQFAIHAYCFMPNDVHLLLEGLSDSSDLHRFVRDWKRRTTFDYRSTTGEELWQRGHFDHVLRPDEDTDLVMRYVLGIPVRAGLVAHAKEYRHAGSDTAATDDWLLRAAEAETHECTQGSTPRSAARTKHQAPSTTP